MSTYFYLQCVSHDPPLQSESEVEQHWTPFLDVIRGIVRDRELGEFKQPWQVINGPAQPYSIHDFWEAVAHAFVQAHPTCRIELVSEYGEREAIV